MKKILNKKSLFMTMSLVTLMSFCSSFTSVAFATNCLDSFNPDKSEDKFGNRAVYGMICGTMGTVLLGAAVPISLVGTVPAMVGVGHKTRQAAKALINDNKMAGLLAISETVVNGNASELNAEQKKLMNDFLFKLNHPETERNYIKTRMVNKARSVTQKIHDKNVFRPLLEDVEKEDFTMENVAAMLVEANQKGTICRPTVGKEHTSHGHFMTTHHLRKLIRNGALSQLD